MQPIVSFRADDPDDRVGMTIGRRDDRRTLALQSAAPAGDEGRRRTGAGLQDRQRLAPTGIRAVRTRPLECYVNSFTGRLGGRCRADRAGCDDLGGEAAANATEAAAIEEVGAAVLAER